MSVITQITDYESRLVTLLLGQFKTGTNWLSLWKALADTGNAFQLSEDVIYLLWQQRTSLDSAVGRQLDQWGAVLGLPREGWTDATYRARILVWLQVLRSKGTPDELIRIASDLTSSPLSGVMLWETPPACYSLQVAAPGSPLWVSDQELALDLARYLARADPAGVGIGQIIDLPAPAFTFGSAGGNGFSGGAPPVTRGLLCVDLANEAGVG